MNLFVYVGKKLYLCTVKLKNNKIMMALDYNKHKVDLSKRGCVPAANFNGRWSCTYGNNGISIAKHNYYTKNGALITVYDVYVNGVYEVSFDTKKCALEYAEVRENGFNLKK